MTSRIDHLREQVSLGYFDHFGYRDYDAIRQALGGISELGGFRIPMLQKQVMIITFRDGRQETYKFNRQETKNGELHFWMEYSGPVTTSVRDEFYIPLDNIYIRKVEDDLLCRETSR